MRVTSLEPRTQCQPEKLKKLSKNDSLLLFSFLESTKSVRIYRVCFQSSAARPQGCDRIWCRAPRNPSVKTRLARSFRRFPIPANLCAPAQNDCRVVKIERFQRHVGRL